MKIRAGYRLVVGFGLLAAVACLPAGCGGPGRDYVAVVDGKRIYLDEFESRFKAKLDLMRKNAGYGEAQIGSLKREFLDEMIDERIMLSRANKLGIGVSEDELRKKIDEIKSDYANSSFSELFKEKKDFNAWREELRKRTVLEKLIDREVNARVSVSDAETRAYYDRNPVIWAPEDNIRVSQIVVPERRTAEEVLRRLKEGEDFSKLAREISTGPEGAKGGDLGFFTRGMLPEHFDRVLFSLAPGKVSRIVETPYGFHIFKVVEKIEKSSGFEKVQGMVKEKLRREKEEKEYETWLTALRSGASIAVNQAVLERAGESR